jgi:UDP-N-acetylglucosamine--N-acetylmuramyl-(pentapeptide) pyrophosphoryl-undecaprenol N-acetylglucosamine transferase
VSRAGQSVLIMAGGTGGHIFPGLAVAASLRQRGVEVRWLGARGGMECQRVPSWGVPLDVVDISGLRGKGLLRWLLIPWKLLRAVLQAARLMGERRPGCAISFGGYAAGPGGLAAKLRGVPLLVHEQNRIPGLTNRVLARIAARVLQAFPGTWGERLRPVTCGNPVRQDVAALAEPGTRLAGRSGPVRLLVTGGSQGARALNRLVPEALGLAVPGLRIEVRHQCGRGWQDETRAAYRVAAVEAEVTEFIEDMAGAYAWADAVLCRAGALTVSEVAAAGVAAVFVPFPHAVDDHQTRNAEYLVERGAALLLSESGLDARRMADTLSGLLGDRARQLDMAIQARAAAMPDAAGQVADLCREFLAS